MISVILHGSLAEKFGDKHRLDVQSSAEAIRGLCQLPGFKKEIFEGNWQVVKGSLSSGRKLDESGLQMFVKEEEQINILPSIEGAGGDGVGKVIMGAAMIGAAFIPGMNAVAVPYLIGAGSGMALGGVAMMLGSTPGGDYANQEAADQRPSFLFNGPVNTSTQGLPVPLIYGRMLVGSSVISAGITAEELS